MVILLVVDACICVVAPPPPSGCVVTSGDGAGLCPGVLFPIIIVDISVEYAFMVSEDTEKVLKKNYVLDNINIFIDLCKKISLRIIFI